MPSRRRPIELIVALSVAVVFHGGLLLGGSYRSTYDAYVHLFFADHYRRNWFSTWEPRWYTGFTTVSYPPGVHQLLALASKVVGLGNAFPVVGMFAVLLLIVGVYRFSLIWVSPRAAGYAAILAALSSSVAEALHVFGQLPTLLSLGFLLNGLPFAHRWIRDGGFGSMAAGIICTAATTAAHHVTTLFGVVFFFGPVALHAILFRWRLPLPGELSPTPLGDHDRDSESEALAGVIFDPLERPLRLRGNPFVPTLSVWARRAGKPVLRTFAYLAFAVSALIFVVLPYWLWSAADPITQTAIPHASRDSFITNTNAGLIFFIIPWGVILIALPYIFMRGATSRAWPLTASIALLAFLGTGGTTPIPRLLLGGAYDVLTLDRFTFWATIAVLPLAGRFVESLVHGRLGAAARLQFGKVIARTATVILGIGVLVSVAFTANLSSVRPFQPKTVDPGPIVSFLEKDRHSDWRYLGLGLGDQMAWISALTTAETVDGNYHSARRLPELTSASVERLEGAKFRGIAGIGSLQQFLAAPEKYHLKFVFSNDHFYDPLLAASGWQHLEPLANGISLWQYDDVSPLPLERVDRELIGWQRLLWGLVPMGVISLATLMLGIFVLGFELAPVSHRRSRKLGPLQLLWTHIDAMLKGVADKHTFAGPSTEVRRSRLRLVGKRFLQPVKTNRRRLQVVGLCTVLILGALTIPSRASTKRAPNEVVFAYYDALDLRNLAAAFDHLDPVTRPGFAQFSREQATINGLVSSYGRLSRIEKPVVVVKGDRATVTANLVYLTALSEYKLPIEEELQKVDSEWKLEPRSIDLQVPPEVVVSRASLRFLGLGRRQVTSGPAAYQDVLDRPELQIPSARLVRHDQQLSVVGEALNVDSVPASVTVTATLIGKDGKVLSWYTGATASAHTALPGELIPFRIDFEGVAGLRGDDKALEFSPAARTPLPIKVEDIAEVWINAKALVTTNDLDRPLVAQDIQTLDDKGLRLLLRNDGVDEATVPHLLVTLRTSDGKVGWVDSVFTPQSVRAQRGSTVDVPITALSEVEQIDIPTRLFANSVSVSRASASPLIGAVNGWDSADLTVLGFTRIVG